MMTALMTRQNDEEHVEPRESDSESAEDATSDGECSNEVDVTDNCLHWKGQDKVGKVKYCTHI
jgi:hypothetical protein